MYLGTTSSPAIRDAMRDGLLGLVRTPGGGSFVPGAAFCIDNGRFGKGWPGADAWFAWVQTHPIEGCLFVTAPDVVGDAAATLAESLPWLPRIREAGYRAALVAQDGLEELEVPWDDMDALFIGGTTDWKMSAHARTLIAEAKRRGKWVHMGRVNSEKRFRYAHFLGCDSADGTFLAFGPDVNLPRLKQWLRATDQPSLLHLPSPSDTTKETQP